MSLSIPQGRPWLRLLFVQARGIMIWKDVQKPLAAAGEESMLSLVCPRNITETDWRGQAQLGAGRNGARDHRNPAADPWNRILDKLASFRSLDNDWDGQGACPPSSELRESASALAALLRARGLDAPSAVAPGPAGTVLFVWQEKDGVYCEVEIERPFCAEVMLVEPGAEACHWTLPDEK